MPAKSNLPVPTLPAKLFSKLKVAVAGRFNYSPNKEELLKFLKREGATIVEKATNDLNILIVGGGAKPAMRAQVEKLNASGAGIQIIEDLEQLFNYSLVDSIANLTDSPTLQHFCSIPSFAIGKSSQHTFVGDDFSGQVIDGGKSNQEAPSLAFDGCNFKKATIRSLSILDYQRHYTRGGKSCMRNCSFESSSLERVTLGNLSDCTLDRTQLSKTNLGALRDVTLKNCKIDDFQTSEVSQSRFEKCVFDKWEANGYGSAFDDCQLRECKIKELEFSNKEWGELKKVELHGCTIESSQIEGITFHHCLLDGVVFRDCTLGRLTFKSCTLKDCSFENTTLGSLHLLDSTIHACRAKKSAASVANATKEQLAEIKGLIVASTTQDLSKLNELQELARVILKAGQLEFNFDGVDKDGKKTTLVVSRQYSIIFCHKQEGKESTNFNLNLWGNTKATNDDVVEGLLRLIQESRLDQADLGSLQTKSLKSPVKANDLKKLIVAAVYQAMGKEPQSEEALVQAQKETKDRVQKLRQTMLDKLDAGEVAAFNRVSATERKQVDSLRKLKLNGKSLSKLNASGLDLSESDFSGANLSASNLSDCNLRKVDFSGAQLQSANLKDANLRGANLSKASLSGAKLRSATLQDCVLSGAAMDQADLSNVDLTSVDLSQVKLDGAKLAGARYDGKTQLPSSLALEAMQTMLWVGGGVPPHERKLNAKVTGPLDFPLFMDRLTEITDSSRLQKSMQMLKKDSFKLFCEVATDGVMGVVKSQSDPDLVYSCMLNQNGDFTCCTQNLNPCGGLRGAICKHILVLVVGLAKNNELDPTKIDEWVNLSKIKSPSLDKDRMSEILLKYKGAEAGEIDWRPTETVPEDFFAF